MSGVPPVNLCIRCTHLGTATLSAKPPYDRCNAHPGDSLKVAREKCDGRDWAVHSRLWQTAAAPGEAATARYRDAAA